MGGCCSCESRRPSQEDSKDIGEEDAEKSKIEPLNITDATLDSEPPSEPPTARQAPSSVSSSGPISSTSSVSQTPQDVNAPASLSQLKDVTLQSKLSFLRDDVRNHLLGNICHPSEASSLNFTLIYIGDPKANQHERSYLISHMHETLRSHCANRGVDFTVVDLYSNLPPQLWNTHYLAQLQSWTLKASMASSIILPVVFLGTRNCQPGFPLTLSSALYKTLSEEKTLEKVLKTLYCQSESSKYYVLRHPAPPLRGDINSMKTQAKEEAKDKEKLLNTLWKISSNADDQTTLFHSPLIKDILSILDDSVSASNTVWVYRMFSPQSVTITPTSPEPSCPYQHVMYTQGDSALARLKESVSEQQTYRPLIRCPSGLDIDVNNPDHVHYLKTFNEHITKTLTMLIDRALRRHFEKDEMKGCVGISPEFQSHLRSHALIGASLTSRPSELEDIQQEIQSYLKGDNQKPIVVCGGMGSGKSTLLANAASNLKELVPHSAVIWCGGGVSQRKLLRNLLEHLFILLGEHPSQLCLDVDRQIRLLQDLLNKWPSNQLMVIFVDGYLEGMGGWKWLPLSCPSQVKIVISITAKSVAEAGLKARLCDSQESVSWLHIASEDSGELQAQIPKRTANPLHSQIYESCWQLSLEDQKNAILQQQISRLFTLLENIFGKAQIDSVLGMLTAAGVQGISHWEMLGLLESDPVIGDNFYACYLWSSVVYFLSAYLLWTDTWGIPCVSWRYDSLQQAATQAFSQDLTNIYKRLFKFIEEKRRPSIDAKTEKTPQDYGNRWTIRQLLLLPYLSQKLDHDIKNKYLLNKEWLYASIKFLGPTTVLDQLDAACNANPEDSVLSQLRQAICDSNWHLSYDGCQFWSQLTARLPPHHPFSSDLPIPSLIPLGGRDVPLTPPTFRGHSLFKMGRSCSEEKHIQLDMDTNICLLEECPGLVVLNSAKHGTVRVWDVHARRAVRTLRGLHEPREVKMVDQYRAVILCGRELLLYNLNTGKFLMKLKGVMNQKMPFYGIHDMEHVVALSRNRMYINLLNLVTGDCVTTFKVGEDRFLNSLLISADGRICVCGDETQKPSSPLLVWDLGQRKLLYDLRIPHHEFLTHLAAITKQGNFIACACHELSENKPHSVAVYDLISGTLFKKWKPAADVCSLTIGSEGSLVIGGLTTGQILVWDLLTGNCQWTLCGHSCPPKLLRLDQGATRLLSLDTSGLEHTLKFWDLKVGKQLSAFTPDEAISSVKLTLDGSAIVGFVSGQINPITWVLSNEQKPEKASPQLFGNEEFMEKEFDVSDAG